MINTDYRIEAMDILLDKACLGERYYPLLESKELLISRLKHMGCERKSDAQALSDEELMQAGLTGQEMTALFRLFLRLYDTKPQKLRELAREDLDPEERAAFEELYLLPGVKRIRASLYYRSGYGSLAAFASASAEDILEKTALTISENGLSCIVPLPKEVRTHIAVARVFTLE